MKSRGIEIEIFAIERSWAGGGGIIWRKKFFSCLEFGRAIDSLLDKFLINRDKRNLLFLYDLYDLYGVQIFFPKVN